jgi:hypothetical protein
MNDPTESIVPEHQRAQYESVLALVRQLSSGELTYDPSVPRISRVAMEPPPEPAHPWADESGVVDEGFYYECRCCKYRYPMEQKLCVMCGCAYFDRRREP